MSIEGRLSSGDFDTATYIKEIAYRFDSSEELTKHKKQIQTAAEQTAQKLKHNVYQNFTLFIDTSREISSLETEMYQLSHLLNEHQRLTSVIQRVCVAEEEEHPQVEVAEKQEKHSIASLLETVEGCSIVTEVPGRYLVFSSRLTELDPQTYESVQEVKAFLLNDSIMLATVKAKRRGPVLYQFQALYELDNLAIVDKKDSEFVRSAFEIKMFPDSNLFQAENESIKQQWMERIKVAKQMHNAHHESVKQVELQAQQLQGSRRYGSLPTRTMDRKVSEVMAPSWLKDAPENLDVYVAQREFDQAVELIEKAKQHLKNSADALALRDIRVRINHRANLLSEVLQRELESPSGSLQGGPRAARRAVSLLLRLGRAAKACELFLMNHSRILDHELRQIKMEGATCIYVDNVSSAFFHTLSNAAQEFQTAFGDNVGGYSAFVIWSIRELQSFLELYCIECIFPPVKSNLSLSSVSDCISSICNKCKTMHKVGLDLTFKVTEILHVHVCKALKDASELLAERLSTMGATDTWEPMDCRKNQAQVAQIILQLDNIGVPSPSNLVHNNIVDLSKTTFTSCQSILNYVESFLKIYTPELLETFVDCFCDIFRHVIVGVIGKAMDEEEFLPFADFLQKNAELLIHSALPALAIKIQDKIGRNLSEVVQLQEELEEHLKLVQSGFVSRGHHNGASTSEDDDEGLV